MAFVFGQTSRMVPLNEFPVTFKDGSVRKFNELSQHPRWTCDIQPIYRFRESACQTLPSIEVGGKPVFPAAHTMRSFVAVFPKIASSFWGPLLHELVFDASMTGLIVLSAFMGYRFFPDTAEASLVIRKPMTVTEDSLAELVGIFQYESCRFVGSMLEMFPNVKKEVGWLCLPEQARLRERVAELESKLGEKEKESDDSSIFLSPLNLPDSPLLLPPDPVKDADLCDTDIGRLLCGLVDDGKSD